jgi:hypothetical protein
MNMLEKDTWKTGGLQGPQQTVQLSKLMFRAATPLARLAWPLLDRSTLAFLALRSLAFSIGDVEPRFIPLGLSGETCICEVIMELATHQIFLQKNS